MAIRAASPKDAQAIAAIYNPYVLHSCITFEEVPVTADEITQRIAAVQVAGLPWLVAEDNGQVVGYAYAAPWRSRPAYRYAVESTVYLAPEAARRGVATRLYGELTALLRKTGYHAVIAGIAQPNERSVALHEAYGFVKVAHFPEVGFKFGKWLDVGYWQLLL